jgi:gas vesicle protein
MKKTNIILSVMAGVVTGLILGILFAPYKGSKTRRKISRAGGELTDEIRNRFHHFGEFISEKLDSTRGSYKHFIRTGKNPI